MLRFVTPVDDIPHRLFHLDTTWWGPEVLVAFPELNLSASKEYDPAFIDDSGRRIGKENPYSKFLVDGNVCLHEDSMFEDDVLYSYSPSPVSYPHAVYYGDYGMNPLHQDPHGRYYKSDASDDEPYTIIGFEQSGGTAIGHTEPGYSCTQEITWEFHSPTNFFVARHYLLEDDTAYMSFVFADSSAQHRYEFWDRLYPYRRPNGHWYLYRDWSFGYCWISANHDKNPSVIHTADESKDVRTRTLSLLSDLPGGYYFSSVPFPKIQTVMNGAAKIKNKVRDSLKKATEPPHGVFPVLQEKAINATKILDHNMIMFVHDLINLKADFENLQAAGVTALEDGKKAFSRVEAQKAVSTWAKEHGKQLSQDVANVYLPLLYGYGLTVDEASTIGEELVTFKKKWQDLYRVFQARSRQEVTRSDGRKAQVNFLGNFSVKDNLFSQIYAGLYNSGFWPTLVTAYDFIPYSFCLDWFIKIGDLLDQIDRYAYRCNLDAVSVVRSTIVDDEAWPVKGNFDISNVDETQIVMIKDYHRWVNKSLDTPPLTVDTPMLELDTWTHFAHWTEASSLVIQRL